MKNIMFAVVALLVLFQLYRLQSGHDMMQHVDRVYQGIGSIPNQAVVLYEAAWCNYCKKARRYFELRHIPFQSIDIEQTDQGYDQFKKLGGREIPLITIGERIIRGYNPDVLKGALQDAGYL